MRKIIQFPKIERRMLVDIIKTEDKDSNLFFADFSVFRGFHKSSDSLNCVMKTWILKIYFKL